MLHAALHCADLNFVVGVEGGWPGALLAGGAGDAAFYDLLVVFTKCRVEFVDKLEGLAPLYS